jgi:hypothetical protein
MRIASIRDHRKFLLKLNKIIPPNKTGVWMFEDTPELHEVAKLAVVPAEVNPRLWLFENTPELNEVAKVVAVPAGVDLEVSLFENTAELNGFAKVVVVPAEEDPGAWLFENTPDLNEFENNVAVPARVDPWVWLFENTAELNEVANGVGVLAGVTPELWLLENTPAPHDVAKLVVPDGVNPAFSWGKFIPLLLVSGTILFSMLRDSALDKLPPFAAFTLSQLTTSLNFSWKKRLNKNIFLS